jgi:hypothetical protein
LFDIDDIGDQQDVDEEKSENGDVPRSFRQRNDVSLHVRSPVGARFIAPLWLGMGAHSPPILYNETGSSSDWGNTVCLMFSDILLKEMQGRCFSSFQEDDGDGKVPVSAFTRRDGHWPG